MSKRSSKLYLQDILDSLANIKEYTKELSFEGFAADQKTVDAVVRNIEIVGEATRNIPEEIKEGNPDVPWKRIMDMRNRVIHEYFGVDLEILWKTVTEDLDFLEEKVKKIIQKLES